MDECGEIKDATGAVLALGDIVELASGGPEMTVMGLLLGDDLKPNAVACIWFNVISKVESSYTDDAEAKSLRIYSGDAQTASFPAFVVRKLASAS